MTKNIVKFLSHAVVFVITVLVMLLLVQKEEQERLLNEMTQLKNYVDILENQVNMATAINYGRNVSEKELVALMQQTVKLRKELEDAIARKTTQNERLAEWMDTYRQLNGKMIGTYRYIVQNQEDLELGINSGLEQNSKDVIEEPERETKQKREDRPKRGEQQEPEPKEESDSFEKDPSLYHDAAYQASKRGDYKKAIKLVKKAIELDSTRGEFYLTLGVFYIRQQDYKKALEVFGEGLQNSTNHQRALHNNLGLTYVHPNSVEKDSIAACFHLCKAKGYVKGSHSADKKYEDCNCDKWIQRSTCTKR